MARTHAVAPGDCMASIAAKYGFAQWETIWNHPKNAGIKQRRKNPNVLAPGDQIFVPDPTPGSYACATGSRHTFQVQRAKTRLRLQLVDGSGQAYANAAYTVEVGKGGAPVVKSKGTTPGNGLIDVLVPADATSGKVTLVPEGKAPEDAIEWTLRLGHLDPIQEASGARARLDNLFPKVPGLEVADADRQKALLLAFQELYGLPETGELDDATAQKLEQLHDTVT